MAKRRVCRHEVTQPRDQSIKLIPLTKGLNAIVDANDYEWLNRSNWYAQKARDTFYAARHAPRLPSGKQPFIYMHREILRTTEGIDHINRNGLDNRRMNLRVCSWSQNNANRQFHPNHGGFKGVYPNGDRWSAKICVNRTRRHIGCFATAEEAARAYDKAARYFFGEFAHTNFES